MSIEIEKARAAGVRRPTPAERLLLAADAKRATPMQRVLGRVDINSLADHVELDEFEVSSAIDIAVTTLRQWRHRKVGPPYVKYGKRVRYMAGDLKKFRAAQRVRIETTGELPRVRLGGPPPARRGGGLRLDDEAVLLARADVA